MGVVPGRSTWSLAGDHMRRLLLAIILASFGVMPSEARENLARPLTDRDVKAVAAKLLPDFCGADGGYCGYAFSDRSEVCPFELWITLPTWHQEAGWPKSLWVGLDERKHPIAMASHKKYGDAACANRHHAS